MMSEKAKAEDGVNARTVLKVSDPEAEAMAKQVELTDKNHTFKIAVAKLEIKNRDVLIVRVPNGTDAGLMRALYTQARSFLRAEGLMEVRLLVLEAGFKMESLNPEMMETYGWIRKK